MLTLTRGSGSGASPCRGAAAGTLTAGFDAFEAIRAAARGCEDRAPGLLPAFMLAAGAAVEGRNAVAAALSLPPS